MTPQEAMDYWDKLNQEPLPTPTRKYTKEDDKALRNYYRRDYNLRLPPNSTGKGYLDLLQKIRRETGEPANAKLFDNSHIMTAVFIDEKQSKFAR